MKFLALSESRVEEDPESWGLVRNGVALAEVVRMFGICGGQDAGIILRFWWETSLPSLAHWIAHGGTAARSRFGTVTLKCILGTFGQPGG